MENNKREEIISLYDLYYNLLTDKQRDYFEEYYFSDLSISEIAINFDISRNGVHDQLKRAVANLYSFEEKLGLLKKIEKINNLEIDDNIKSEIIDIIKE
ncbi:MAG: hypothetical protein IJR67_00370 [Acholeplasmatales bacterium]|nr:hypothetical protein [Acholeplasmatales bacterium]